MKNIHFPFAVWVALALPLAALGTYTETIDGITWTYEVSVTHLVSDGMASLVRGGDDGAVPTSTIGAIAIPSSLGGYPVRRIGESAFDGCSGLTSVTIPDSVTSIRDSAFSGCSGLTSVTIPDSVTNIGQRAFYNCSGLTSVTIGNSVPSIGYEVFLGCSGLTSVRIPDSVTSIGRYAFYGCSGLNYDTHTIPGVRLVDGWAVGWTDSLFGALDLRGVRGFAASAFSGCSVLTSVTIPDGVTAIGNGAFYGCSNLTSVAFPESVTSIGNEAFYGCSGLTNLVFPEKLSMVGRWAFCGCSGLTSVTIPGWVDVERGAFGNCSGLTVVYIHDLATWCKCWFENSANPLYYAHHLYLNGEEVKDLVIPYGVTGIGWNSFSGCTGLTSVTIPESVTSIGWWAFSGCRGLTSVRIPDSVTSIGDGAFRDCSGLTSVTIGNGVTDIGNGVFDGCKGVTFISTGDGLMSLNNLPITTSLHEIIIGEGVTGIEDSTFSGCSGLTSVTIPDSVTSIGYWPFYGCSGLRTVSVPGAWEGTGMLDDVWGWQGKPLGCEVVYRKTASLPEAKDEGEVTAALAEAADGQLGERIRSVEEYAAFRAWVAGKGLDAGAVKRSAHAWISYALGADGLFENEPSIKLEEMSVGTSGEGKRDVAGTILKVSVTVRDGEQVVNVDASKVAALFECTSDLADWTGEAALKPTVAEKGSEGEAMRFEVTPAGPGARAFLRIAE